VTNVERTKLHEYFSRVDAIQARLRSDKPSDSGLRLLAKRVIPPDYRGTARMLLTNASEPWQKRKLRAIKERPGPLRLHLGCGGEAKEGWVNIDLIGDPVELAWNLAHGVPFDDSSVSAIFHEHLLEHIPLRAGIGFMDECFRVMEPGAIMRIGVPDAGRLLESYNGDRSYLERIHPGRPTGMLAVQELFYWHRHMTMYDEETLALLFRAAGFEDPKAREYGDTELERAPDTAWRAPETLYMEARKPR
jgi:predicted SAM-dependent methyltransferase